MLPEAVKIPIDTQSEVEDYSQDGVVQIPIQACTIAGSGTNSKSQLNM